MIRNTLSRFIHPNLLEGKIFKSLVTFTIPILISYLFQQLYNAVDTIIVGNYLNENALAAIGASAPINELIVGFGTGFGSGMGLVVARAFGSGNEKKLKNQCISL